MQRSLMATRVTSLIAAALAAAVMVACGSSGTSHKASPKPANNAAPQFIPADNTLGTPLIGEIRMFAGTFAPVGYHLADGSTMNISDNNKLFSVIGTTFGGDGKTTFGLPKITSPFPNILYLVALTGTFPSPASTNSSQRFTGQIGMFAGGVTPSGWRVADGSVLAIKDSQDLYSVIGTTFGGDGKTTFALPKITSPFPNIQFLIADNGAFPKANVTEPNSYIIGELAMFAGAPYTGLSPVTGWDAASGGLLSINQNQALYSLLSTRFGGDGRTNFQLPNITTPFPHVSFLVAVQGTYPAHQ